MRTLNGLGSAASDPEKARSWYEQQTKTKDILTAKITVEGSDSGPWGSPTAVLVSGLIRSLVKYVFHKANDFAEALKAAYKNTACKIKLHLALLEPPYLS